MKVVIMVFTKMVFFRTNGPFWVWKWHILITGLALRIFFKFCRMKRADKYMEIFLVVFREKINLGQFDLFSLYAIFYCLIEHGQIEPSLSSQDMTSFMITTGSLNSQDMIRILKQSRHDFSGKHLCDGYCMDIM